MNGAKKDAIWWPGIALTLIALALMLCWGYDHRGGDGNYFIAGLLPAILLGLAAAWRQLPAALHGRLLIWITAFCLFQAAYSFASACWTTGTRAFDLDFSHSPRNLRRVSQRWFEQAGIARVAAHLRHLHRNARVIGCTEAGDALGMRLPASYENISQIKYARPEFTDSAAHLQDFIRADRIEYLVVPRPPRNDTDCEGAQALRAVVATLRDRGVAPTVEDERYLLYDTTQL